MMKRNWLKKITTKSGNYIKTNNRRFETLETKEGLRQLLLSITFVDEIIKTHFKIRKNYRLDTEIKKD